MGEEGRGDGLLEGLELCASLCHSSKECAVGTLKTIGIVKLQPNRKEVMHLKRCVSQGVGRWSNDKVNDSIMVET